MSIDTEMDKGDVVHIYCTMEYYSAIKKDEIMPFAVTQMDLETVILSKSDRGQISHDIACMWNIKKWY